MENTFCDSLGLFVNNTAFLLLSSPENHAKEYIFAKGKQMGAELSLLLQFQDSLRHFTLVGGFQEIHNILQLIGISALHSVKKLFEMPED